MLSLLEAFLILLCMCRNNSHACKYCQSLQSSYASIVGSASWARDFRIPIYWLKSVSRTGCGHQCCSKLLCHSFHTCISTTTPHMYNIVHTSSESCQFYIFSSKISLQGQKKKKKERQKTFAGRCIFLTCHFFFLDIFSKGTHKFRVKPP